MIKLYLNIWSSHYYKTDGVSVSMWNGSEWVRNRFRPPLLDTKLFTLIGNNLRLK